MATQTNTLTVNFHLRVGLSEEMQTIYARITLNGKRIELSSKQMMNLSGWNERRGFVKPITDENKKLNDYLQQSRSSYVECYRQMIIQKKVDDGKFQEGLLYSVPSNAAPSPTVSGTKIMSR